MYETEYIYDPNGKLNKLIMKNTNGSVKKYVYGLGLIGEDDNDHFKTYHFDYRGSTVAITNESGAITDRFAYDTYGKQISHTGNSFIIFGYNGRDGVITDVNGLLYMRSRYYSPELRRFVDVDVLYSDILDSGSYKHHKLGSGYPVAYNKADFGMEDNLLGRPIKPKENNDPWLIEKWGTVLDIGISLAAEAIGAPIGKTVETAVAGVLAPIFPTIGPLVSWIIGKASGSGVINNIVNTLYYNYISDGVSSIEEPSYKGEGENQEASYYVSHWPVNRWDRLDYTKYIMESNQFSNKYDLKARQYYSEYNFHLYVWRHLGWTSEKGYPMISGFAESSRHAYVTPGKYDKRPSVTLLTILLELLGL
jgi:RHS repeat-associated protein